MIREPDRAPSFVRCYEVELNIPADEVLRYYRGAASVVIARDRYGQRLQFPAAALRRFVTAAGVHGRFVLRVDGAGRLRSLERAAPPDTVPAPR